jgi:hypothetical protein
VSLFVQLTDVPAGMVSAAGEKAKLRIFTWLIPAVPVA